MPIGKEITFQDIEIGTALPALIKEISIPQMARYAAVCWDFQPEHYDSGTARENGFQAAYADGPMATAFLGQVVTDWIGPFGVLKKITVTYRGMMFPGDTLTCNGKVTDKSMAGATLRFSFDVWAENQKSEKVIYGTATAEIPVS